MNTIQSIYLGLYNIYEIIVRTSVNICFIDYTSRERDDIYKYTINNCNNYCNDISYEIGWKCCELLTFAGVVYRKNIIPTFHHITNEYFRCPVLLIKDGNEWTHTKDIDLWKEIMNYDLILYTDYSENDPRKNYTMISESRLEENNSTITNKSNINFIMFQLTMNNEAFDINLKEPYNFLLTNNVLTFYFFRWYMKKIYNKVLTKEYSVNYMTNDMILVNLNSPFCIKISKDNVMSFSTEFDIYDEHTWNYNNDELPDLCDTPRHDLNDYNYHLSMSDDEDKCEDDDLQSDNEDDDLQSDNEDDDLQSDNEDDDLQSNNDDELQSNNDDELESDNDDELESDNDDELESDNDDELESDKEEDDLQSDGLDTFEYIEKIMEELVNKLSED